MDIIAGLAAASNAIDIAKAMRAADKNFDQAVYRGQMAELMIALSEAKMALMEAREKLTAQDAEIERIRSDRPIVDALKVGRGGYRYQVAGDGEPMGYPACPACLENEVRVVPLVRNGIVTEASCPRCKSKYSGVTSFARSPSGQVESEVSAGLRVSTEAMDRARQASPRGQFY